MDSLNSVQQLKSNHQSGFQAKPAPTKVKEVLQVGTQKFQHQTIWWPRVTKEKDLKLLETKINDRVVGMKIKKFLLLMDFLCVGLKKVKNVYIRVGWLPLKPLVELQFRWHVNTLNHRPPCLVENSFWIGIRVLKCTYYFV